MTPSNPSRYTPFPNLHPNRKGEDRRSDLRVTRTLPVSTLRVGELVVAWAAVLLAYSGAGEEVVIAVDNKTVKVSPSHGTVSPIHDDQPNLDGVDKTGIFTERGDPAGFCLYVRLASDGYGCLVSQSELVPAEHLSSIAAELAARIQWARQYPDEEFTFRRERGLRPSELNIKPELLAGPVLLHRLFEIHAYRDDAALEYRDVTGKRCCYSYREVNSLSECFASQLRVRLARCDRSETKKQHVVPLLVPQSPALYVAILAILKAGAAFCPLDPEAPVERLRFILADLSAGIAIAEELSAAKLVWDNGPEVVRVHAAMSTPDGTRGRAGSNTPALDGSDLAYVMYTSGSTGTPKGVGVAHSSVTQSLHAHERHIPEFTRFLQFAAPTFDVFVFEMFFALSRGKTLVSSDRQSLLNDLPSTINELSVDGAVMTPTVVGALLQKRENVPGLRVLMTIGEMLTRPVVDEFGDSLERPGILYAMYGPTEAAVHCTIASKLQAGSKVGIIGQPLETVAAYVIAPYSGATSPGHSLDVLPVGHVGELVVGGHQLATGYLNRPEQTATAFITTEELGRVYRTGDKARLLPNGMLECLGRLIDDQVKLRGHRLELGEIERVAADTPGVRHAIAAIIDGILVVFCLPSQEGTSTAAIYETCRRWLPSPIVPEDVRMIQEIPRVASGKADKRALEADYRRPLRNIDDRPRNSESDTATKATEETWTHDERTIRAVLARLAGLEESRIGRHTTIFQMGLDSVQAVKIAADFRELGLTVHATDVLQHTSISGLAEFVGRSSNGTKHTLPDFDFRKFDADYRPTLSSALGIPDSKWRSVRPCTPVQSAMIAGFISSEGNMYLSHILMELQDGVSVVNLERAWNAVAAKHTVLRTGFARTGHAHHPFAMLEYHIRDRSLAWQNINCRSSVTEEIDNQRESVRRRLFHSLIDPPWQICVFRDKKVFVQLSALHSLFDAQSLHMILSDVATALAGQILSQEVPIEPVLGAILTSSIADADTHRDFWQRLGSNMQSTVVPSLSPLYSAGGKCLTRSLQSSWTGKELEERAAFQGVTVAAVGQAAWARLLAAYVGQITVTFGIVLSARTVMEETLPLAFPCVTTLPVGYHVQNSNRELLVQVMKRNSEVAVHQQTSLRKVQEWIMPNRGTMFNTIFAFQKRPKETKGALPWQTVEEVLRVDYAVSVELEITGDDRVILSLTFEEDILPLPQAELLLRQLEEILTDTISNPDGPSSDFGQMAAGLLSIERAKDHLIPSKFNLAHEFVEHFAAVSPRKVAVEYCQDLDNPNTTKSEWTYSELNAAGNRVRDIVLRQGLNVGDLVAICFDKCPEASFAILGILKAGCGYVALDPDAPIARKKFILEDSGVKLVLTAGRHVTTFAEAVELPTVPISRGSVQADSSTVQLCPTQPVHPDSICYCLYTSGTTGTPKGCEITHKNVVQAILAFQRIFAGRWTPESRWLQFASYHFDVSVLEQLWSWSVGISVVSVPRDLMLSDLPGTIQKLGITHIDLTPSLARTLHPSEAPGLYGGVFITGGELLKQEIIDAWGRHGCIHNGYGPTESTIGNTMKPRVGTDGKPSNIGPQFDNVGTYVVTPGTDIPIPRGAVGELCVSGPLVGRGYRNRTDLTKHRFPYLETYGERVYRTGDLVRLLHNGDFDYVGRTDHQVKLRGQRLELAEVDEVIKKGISEVSEVASLVLRHRKIQSEQLVCFVVLKQRRRPQPTPSIDWSSQNVSCIRSIRDVCRAKLPGYGVPTHIIPVNYLPLSFTNKLDLNRLKDMYQDATLSDLQRLSDLARSPNNAWSEAEEKVVNVLGEFLGRDKKEINRDTNLFELGLDSISVIELANVLRERGFSQAKPSIILQNAVTDGLVKALSGKKQPPASLTNLLLKQQQELYAFSHKHAYVVTLALGISHDSIEAILPCTPLQEGMLTATMTRNNSLYLNAFYFDLNANVSLTQLQAAWNAVVRKCPVLRLCFCATSDGYTQVFQKAAEPNIVKLALSSEEMLPTVRQNRLNKWRGQDVASFKEPLQVLFLQAPLKTVMVVHLFHALYDGISLNLMLQRLNEEYHNAKDLKYGPSFLEVLPLGPLLTLRGAKDFWLHHLDGAEPSRVMSVATEKAPEQFELFVELDCIDRLEDAKRRLNVTYQAFFQASWMLTLREHFQRNVTLGMVVSGRAVDIEGAELTIGPMFNTIPFYLNSHSCGTGASVITACHDFNIASLPYQHTPLRDIMKWCRRSKDQPLFDILFVFDRDLKDAHAEQPNLFCLTESTSPAEYPLAVEVRLRRDGHATVTMVAQDSVVDRVTAASLLDNLSRNLDDLISDPDFEPRALSSGQTQAEEELSREGREGRQATLSRTELKQKFSWCREALLLRNELSNLASVPSNEIGSGTSIFDLGLDSIDAIKLSSRLRVHGIMLTVGVIMEKLTISGMLEQVSKEAKSASNTSSELSVETMRASLRMHLPTKPGHASNVEDVLPTTGLQEAMVAKMLSSDGSYYFNHEVLKLLPGVDLSKLMDAWDRVVRSTPILRTSFAEVDDPDIHCGYAQLVHQPAKLMWDSMTVPSEESFEDAIAQVKPRHLYKNWSGPPLRLSVLHHSGDSYLLFSIAHALYDGWSLNLLHEDVHRAYHDTYIPRPSYIPAIELMLQASNLAARDFWSSQLSGVSGTLFIQQPRDSGEAAEVRHFQELQSKVPVSSVHQLLRAHGVTLQALGHVCWSFALAHYMRTLEVVFGAVLAGRDFENAHQMQFPTMNTVPVRSIIHGTCKDMLVYMTETNTRLASFQHCPLRTIQACAGYEGKELFNTIFIVQKRPESTTADENRLYVPVLGESDTEYPVCVEMEVVDDSVLWRGASHDPIIGLQGLQDLLNRLDSVLVAILTSPHSPAVEATDDGTTICGLSPFKERSQTVASEPNRYQPQVKVEASSDEWSTQEQSIRKVLSLVTKVSESEIRKDQTAYHLGLDSISAIKVSSILKKRSINLSVRDILQSPSVGEMAAVAGARSKVDDAIDIDYQNVLEKHLNGLELDQVILSVGVQPAEVEHVLPASSGQVYLLSIWQQTQGAVFYSTFQYRANAKLNSKRLTTAWAALLEQCPILRTTFAVTQSRDTPLVQLVSRSSHNPIRWGYCGVTGDQETEDTAVSPPAIRLLAHQESDGTLLEIQLLHAYYDAVSLPLIVSSLQRLYIDPKATTQSKPGFDEFLAHTVLSSDVIDRRAFWQSYLGSTSHDGARHSEESRQLDHFRRTEVFRPMSLLAAQLEDLTRTTGLTFQSLFLAAYASSLRSLRSQPGPAPQAAVIFGVYLANRSHPNLDLSKLTAPTINFLPLKVSIRSEEEARPGQDLKAMAAQIQQDLRTISSPQNAAVSLWEIDDWTGIRLDSFVNLIKLPAEENELRNGDGNESSENCQNREAEGEREVILYPVESKARRVRREVIILERGGFVEPRALRNSPVKSSYLPSLDIEAKLRPSDDVLDVGVFAPTDMVSLEDADSIIEGIETAFRGLLPR